MPARLPTRAIALADQIDEFALMLLANGLVKTSRYWQELADRVRDEPAAAPCEGVGLDAGLDPLDDASGFRPPFLWGIATGVFGSVAVAAWSVAFGIV